VTTAPVIESGSPVSCAVSLSDWRSFRTTASAASDAVSGSSKAKTSLPSRPSASLERIDERADSASDRSMPSATSGPIRSLTSAKSSRSK
jgi:hypothetical protein